MAHHPFCRHTISCVQTSSCSSKPEVGLWEDFLGRGTRWCEVLVLLQPLSWGCAIWMGPNAVCLVSIPSSDTVCLVLSRASVWTGYWLLWPTSWQPRRWCILPQHNSGFSTSSESRVSAGWKAICGCTGFCGCASFLASLSLTSPLLFFVSRELLWMWVSIACPELPLQQALVSCSSNLQAGSVEPPLSASQESFASFWGSESSFPPTSQSQSQLQLDLHELVFTPCCFATVE